MAKTISASFSVCLNVDSLDESELGTLLRDLRSHIGSTYWQEPVKTKINIVEYQTLLNVYNEQP